MPLKQGTTRIQTEFLEMISSCLEPADMIVCKWLFSQSYFFLAKIRIIAPIKMPITTPVAIHPTKPMIKPFNIALDCG
jgi:hypothetical protein